MSAQVITPAGDSLKAAANYEYRATERQLRLVNFKGGTIASDPPIYVT